MKRNQLIYVALIAAAGCGEPQSRWYERHEPTTDAEREAVARHVEAMLSATPKVLSGHDQDWDDAIVAAHREAKETLCRPTLWERRYNSRFDDVGEMTGRWRYAKDVPIRNWASYLATRFAYLRRRGGD